MCEGSMMRLGTPPPATGRYSRTYRSKVSPQAPSRLWPLHWALELTKTMKDYRASVLALALVCAAASVSPPARSLLKIMCEACSSTIVLCSHFPQFVSSSLCACLQALSDADEKFNKVQRL